MGNVYRSEPYDWDEDDVAAVEAYNRIVEGVLVAAVAARRNERIVEQLQEALDRRVPIERSVGMLMGRHGLDAVAAFAALRGATRTERRRWRTSPRICSPAPRCRGFTTSAGERDRARESQPIPGGRGPVAHVRSLVSTGPDDLAALCAKIVEGFAEGRHAARTGSAPPPDPGRNTALMEKRVGMAAG